MGSLILSWNRGDGPRTGFYTDDEVNGVYFLRVNNLKEHSIDLLDVKYIHREVHEKTLERTQVTRGDVIFAISGTKDNLGTVSIIPDYIEEANLNSALVRLDLDESKITKDFFCNFFDLNIARRQIQFIGKGAAQNNLNNEEISQIKIPLPSLATQRSLVAEIDAARQTRTQKIAQADELLSSLDSYLLDQLGLTPPEESDKQVFSVRLSDVKTRFDVDYHTLRFKKLRRMLEGNSSYPVMTIGEICQTSPRSGFAAGRQDQAFNEDEGVPHIRPLNIKPFGEITFEGTKYVPRECIKNDDVLVPNEVLFNNTNSMEWVGKSAVFTGERKCACSNHITRLLLKKDIAEPFFVATLFNALRSLGFLGILSTNFNNQAGINIETLSYLRIPVPSLNEQRFIISEIQKRRAEGKRLLQEAETEWETAKICFERKLLGEEA